MGYALEFPDGKFELMDHLTKKLNQLERRKKLNILFGTTYDEFAYFGIMLIHFILFSTSHQKFF